MSDASQDRAATASDLRQVGDALDTRVFEFEKSMTGAMRVFERRVTARFTVMLAGYILILVAILGGLTTLK